MRDDGADSVAEGVPSGVLVGDADGLSLDVHDVEEVAPCTCA